MAVMWFWPEVKIGTPNFSSQPLHDFRFALQALHHEGRRAGGVDEIAAGLGADLDLDFVSGRRLSRIRHACRG